MGYYTIKVDPDAQQICTIILPWGKYSYLRLLMGMSGSPDIFQEKMSDLMRTLEYLRSYIDDLFIITPGTYDDHLTYLQVVLNQLQKAGLHINAAKSNFGSIKLSTWGTY